MLQVRINKIKAANVSTNTLKIVKKQPQNLISRLKKQNLQQIKNELIYDSLSDTG